MKQIAQSILDIDNGKMKEQANYELAKIMANLNDINANEKTKRGLTIKLTFLPVDDGTVITSYEVLPKLAPMRPKQLILRQDQKADPETGMMIDVLVETTRQARGQLNLDGEIFEPEMCLIGLGADKLIKKEEVQKD